MIESLSPIYFSNRSNKGPELNIAAIPTSSDSCFTARRYSIDNCDYKSQYVADVLRQHYNADRIICIGTVKSMWDGMYNKFVNDDPDSVWEKLYTFSENSSHKTEITKADFIQDIFKDTLIDPVLIKYGLNKEENEFNIMVETILKSRPEITTIEKPTIN